MSKQSPKDGTEAKIAEGLQHARTLGNLLRDGNSPKRGQMLDEISRHTRKEDGTALTRSLATAADTSLGDTLPQSDAIRAEAKGFRDAIVAHPPVGSNRWDAIDAALAPPNATNTGNAPAASAASCASTGFATVPSQMSLFPSTGHVENDEHDDGDTVALSEDDRTG